MRQKDAHNGQVVIVFSKLQISHAFRLSISIRPSCARSSACPQAALESPRRWFALLLLLHQVSAAGAAAILAQETAQYSRKWGGRAQIAGRGTCTFSLEIKTQPNTSKPFAGYSNLLCIDMTFPAGTKMDRAVIAVLTAERWHHHRPCPQAT